MEFAFDDRKLLQPGVHDASIVTGTAIDLAKPAPSEAQVKVVKAPWTPEQVAALNEFQTAENGHPFTCGGNRTDKYHLDGQGVLVATVYGWVCPYCDYEQDFAYDMMFKPVSPPPWHKKRKSDTSPSEDKIDSENRSVNRD